MCIIRYVHGCLVIRNGNLKISAKTQELAVAPFTYKPGNTKTHSSFLTQKKK